MKTISKKKLYDLFVSYDEWFYASSNKIGYDDLWSKTYSMAHSIEKNINHRSFGELYNIIYGLKTLNKNVTFEQIVMVLQSIGFEVK